MNPMLTCIQEELAQEQQRLAHLRDAFQASYCADELDAATHLAAAHLAQGRAWHSLERIRGLQRLLEYLRHGGSRCCRDCGEEIPWARLLAAPGTQRCRECQQAEEEKGHDFALRALSEPGAQQGLAGNG